MFVLKEVFAFLTLSGVWQPIDWKSKEKMFLYKIYTFYVLGSINLLVLLQFYTICFHDLSFNDFSDILYVSCTISLNYSRGLNFVFNRNNIIKLVYMLKNEYCKPKNYNEKSLQNDADNLIRQATIAANAMVFFTCIGFLTVPFILTSDKKVLPDKSLPPYDIQLARNYWLTYGFEFITIIFSGLLNANEYCLVCGLMFQARVQFDILSLRLQELTDDVRSRNQIQDFDNRNDNQELMLESMQHRVLKDVVCHHLHIAKYVKKISETFYWTLIIQLMAISIIFSFMIYKLPEKNIGSVDFFVTLSYLFCMAAEFFCYCWFGNEVTLKNQEVIDNIYNTDWLVLNRKSQKMLLLIMQQSLKPLVLKSGHFVTLNLESFKSIIKLSYSALNFLRTTA